MNKTSLKVLLGTLPLLLAACDRAPTTTSSKSDPGKASPSAAPVVVQTAAVQRLALPRTVEVTGTVMALEDVAVAAKVPGRITSLALDLGDVCKPGAVLAQIDPKDAELVLREKEAQFAATLAKLGLASIPEPEVDFSTLPAVRRAQAEAANAHARLERATRLHDQQPPLIADQDFADVRTQWEVAARGVETEILAAKATLAEARALGAATETARQALKDTRVEAPSFGPGGPSEFRIAARSVSVGEFTTPGMVLFRVVATQQVKVRGSVPERFASTVVIGQEVSIGIAGSTKPFPGKVSRISPAINPASRTFEVEILADNPTGELKPGAFARSTIITHIEPNVPCVPSDAIVEFAGVERIFAVKDGRAVAMTVRSGQREGELVEVRNLATPPETVVRRPGALRDGATISPRGG